MNSNAAAMLMSDFKFEYSLFIILLVIFAVFYRGINGAASIEVIFVGLLFSTVSLLHASWAIFKIRQLDKKKN